MGQCQRYNEYEINPIKTIGFRLIILLIRVALPIPPKIINAVPNVGKIAAVAGNSVSLV